MNVETLNTFFPRNAAEKLKLWATHFSKIHFQQSHASLAEIYTNQHPKNWIFMQPISPNKISNNPHKKILAKTKTKIYTNPPR